MKKILCLCNHGNVRSAALARCFKELQGPLFNTEESAINEYVQYEAIAMGAHCNTINTIKIFSDWADYVIDMSDEDLKVQERLRKIAGQKYIRFYIGPDNFGTSTHPALLEACRDYVRILTTGVKNEFI